MPTRQSTIVSSETLKSIVGDLDDARVIEILKLSPTLAELEEAAVWAAGDGDVLAREGRPLTGTAAAVVDILVADEEEEPPVR